VYCCLRVLDALPSQFSHFICASPRYVRMYLGMYTVYYTRMWIHARICAPVGMCSHAYVYGCFVYVLLNVCLHALRIYACALEK
jgi:hypothetical protein